MAELDAVEIYNPTKEDFTWRYNGEPYTVPSKGKKSFAKYVAFHLAKHLSTKMISDMFSKEEHADRNKVFEISQLNVYDNPKRRITLYQILKDVLLVQEVIKAYPFKGFLGDMTEYESYVKKEETSRTKHEDKVKTKDNEFSTSSN